MIQEISKSGKFHEDLKKRGKENPKKAIIIKALMEMDEELTEFRKEYRVKETKSRISASKVILA